MVEKKKKKIEGEGEKRKKKSIIYKDDRQAMDSSFFIAKSR